MVDREAATVGLPITLPPISGIGKCAVRLMKRTAREKPSLIILSADDIKKNKEGFTERRRSMLRAERDASVTSGHRPYCNTDGVEE